MICFGEVRKEEKHSRSYLKLFKIEIRALSMRISGCSVLRGACASGAHAPSVRGGLSPMEMAWWCTGASVKT